MGDDIPGSDSYNQIASSEPACSVTRISWEVQVLNISSSKDLEHHNVLQALWLSAIYIEISDVSTFVCIQQLTVKSKQVI